MTEISRLHQEDGLMDIALGEQELIWMDRIFFEVMGEEEDTRVHATDWRIGSHTGVVLDRGRVKMPSEVSDLRSHP